LPPILLVEALFGWTTVGAGIRSLTVKILNQWGAGIPGVQHRRALFEVVLVLNVFVRLQRGFEHVELELGSILADRPFRHRDQRGTRRSHIVDCCQRRRCDLCQAQPAAGPERINRVLGGQHNGQEQRTRNQERDCGRFRELPKRGRWSRLCVGPCIHLGTMK
jgi:hypothetical protein